MPTPVSLIAVSNAVHGRGAVMDGPFQRQMKGEEGSPRRARQQRLPLSLFRKKETLATVAPAQASGQHAPLQV